MIAIECPVPRQDAFLRTGRGVHNEESAYPVSCTEIVGQPWGVCSPPINASDLSGLDAGCGEGMQMHLLHRQGYSRPHGWHRLRRAKDPLFCAYAQPIHLFHRKSECTEFQEWSLDYVIASEVLEHLASPDKAMESLSELQSRRILRAFRAA